MKKKVLIILFNLLKKIFLNLVLLILFILIFVPIGLLFKLVNINLLNKKFNKKLDTYWIKKKNYQNHIK